NIAAGDRAAPARVRVFSDGRLGLHRRAQRRVIARAERAFDNPPAIVAAPADNVYLFAGALADVCDIQLTCRAVEREAPRIAQAVSVYLVAPCDRAKERIINRRAVRLAAILAVYVNAQNLAEQ